MNNIFEGKVYKTNNSGNCVIISYKNSTDVTVRFLDKYKYTVKTKLHDLRSDAVRNPYYPSVKGVGYMGEGKYKTRDKTGKKSKVFQTWAGMMERGYCQKFKNKYPTYSDCSVHPDWHNFQVFAEWYVNHKFFGLGYELDKDIIVKGNTIYSADTCTLVPRDINSLFGNKRSSRGDYPQGVNLHKATGKFRASLSCNNKNKHLGEFTTPEEASAVYVEAKEAHVREVGMKWEGRIEPRAFEALMKWTVY